MKEVESIPLYSGTDYSKVTGLAQRNCGLTIGSILNLKDPWKVLLRILSNSLINSINPSLAPYMRMPKNMERPFPVQNAIFISNGLHPYLTDVLLIIVSFFRDFILCEKYR